MRLDFIVRDGGGWRRRLIESGIRSQFRSQCLFRALSSITSSGEASLTQFQGERGELSLSRLSLRQLLMLYVDRKLSSSTQSAIRKSNSIKSSERMTNYKRAGDSANNMSSSTDSSLSSLYHKQKNSDWYSKAMKIETMRGRNERYDKNGSTMEKLQRVHHFSDAEIHAAINDKLRSSDESGKETKQREQVLVAIDLVRELGTHVSSLSTKKNNSNVMLQKAFELMKTMASFGRPLPLGDTYLSLAHSSYQKKRWNDVIAIANDMEAMQMSRNHVNNQKVQNTTNSKKMGDSAIRKRVLELSLRAHRRLGDISNVEKTFAMLENGHELSASHYNTIISAYGKADRLEEAIAMKEVMIAKNLCPDLVTYNILIVGFKKRGKMNKVLEIVEEIYRAGLKPDELTYNIIIQVYAVRRSLDDALTLMHEVRKGGMKLNTLSYNALIGACKKKAEASKARDLYNAMKQDKIARDAVTYSSLLALYRRRRCHSDLIEVLNDIKIDIKGSSLILDKHLVDDMIWAHAESGSPRKAFAMFEKMSELQYPRTSFTYAGMVAAYGSTGMLREAESVLDEASTSSDTRLDIGLYKLILDVCAYSGQYEMVKLLIDRMSEGAGSQTFMTSEIYNALITALAKNGMYQEAEDVLRLMGKDDGGTKPSLYNYTSLMSAYSSNGKVEDAMRLFGEITEKGMKADVTMFNSLLNAHLVSHEIRNKSGKPTKNKEGDREPEATYDVLDKMKEIMDSMERMKVSPNNGTYSILSRALGLNKCSEQLYNLVESSSSFKNASHANKKGSLDETFDVGDDKALVKAFMNAFCQCGEYEAASRILKNAIDRDMHCEADVLNSLLVTLSQHRRVEEMRSLVYQLLKKESKVLNVVSFTILIDALVHEAGACGEAQDLWNRMVRYGIEPDTKAFNSLISSYAHKNSGYDFAGTDLQIQKIRELMDAYDIKPDSSTFRILLSVYARKGSIDRFRETLSEMEVCGLNLDLPTYTLLISTYMRHGHISEAMELVDDMQGSDIEPDAVALNTMIAANTMSGNVTEARAIMTRMKERNGRPCGVITYNHMIQGFIKADRLTDAKTVLSEMRDEGVTPDLTVYNTLINAFCKSEAGLQEAVNLRKEMKSKYGLDADIFTYDSFLRAHERAARALSFEFPAFDSHSTRPMNTLTDVSRSQQLNKIDKDVEALSSEMSKIGLVKDLRIFNSLASIFASIGSVSKVHHILNAMRSLGIKPDINTYNSVLRVYSSADMVDEARDLLAEMEAVGLVRNTETTSILTNLYRSDDIDFMYGETMIHDDDDDSDNYERSAKWDDVLER